MGVANGTKQLWTYAVLPEGTGDKSLLCAIGQKAIPLADPHIPESHLFFGAPIALCTLLPQNIALFFSRGWTLFPGK